MNYKEFVHSKTFNVGHYGVRAITLYLFEKFKQNPEFEFQPYTDDLNRFDSYHSLLVTTKFDWETKYRNKRPAIFVSRGNLITGVNGTLGTGKFFSSSDGEVSYLDLVSFPIVVECLAESDIESEALSSIVSTFLSLDVRALKTLGIQIQGGVTQTPPQLFEKNNISFISSVIMQTQLERQYKAKAMNDLLLQKIEIALNNSTEIDVTED